MPCGYHAPAGPASWYRPRRKVPNPISTNPDRAAHSRNGRGDGREAVWPRENGRRIYLPCQSPARAVPLSVIRRWDQLLAVSAPTRDAGHAEERPADLAERLVAISADRNHTAAPRPGHGRVCARWPSSLIQIGGVMGTVGLGGEPWSGHRDLLCGGLCRWDPLKSPPGRGCPTVPAVPKSNWTLLLRATRSLPSCVGGDT